MKRLLSKMQNFNTINVENTIQSGQVFLWQKTDDFWYGVNGQNILKVNNFGIINSLKKNKSDFFRKNDDLEKIIKTISKDTTTKKAVKNYLGLRLMDQDPLQCMISFIVSSNSNIQKIKICLEKLSEKFGEKVEYDKKEFFVFPKSERLANAPIKEIMKCGTGYRSKFIKSAAKMVDKDKIDFKELRKKPYSQTREEICKIPGIGNKVADCIMLFSLNKLESFPLDRWMIRILEKYYSNFHLETKTITEKQYDILHENIVSYFGQYAGYAQQFLFKMEREKFDKKWL